MPSRAQSFARFEEGSLAGGSLEERILEGGNLEGGSFRGRRGSGVAYEIGVPYTL